MSKSDAQKWCMSKSDAQKWCMSKGCPKWCPSDVQKWCSKVMYVQVMSKVMSKWCPSWLALRQLASVMQPNFASLFSVLQGKEYAHKEMMAPPGPGDPAHKPGWLRLPVPHAHASMCDQKHAHPLQAARILCAGLRRWPVWRGRRAQSLPSEERSLRPSTSSQWRCKVGRAGQILAPSTSLGSGMGSGGQHARCLECFVNVIKTCLQSPPGVF